MDKTSNPEVKPPIEKSKDQKLLVNGSPGISQEVLDELSEEINNMLSYAVHNGIIIKTEVNSLIQNSNVNDLINAHNLLCKNIAPATPKSIFFLKGLTRNSSKKMFISRLPGIRNLLILALFFLIMFIASGMSVEVNSVNLSKGILGNDGFQLLKIIIYLASISGMGVLFFLLKNIITSLKEGTLIPEDSVEYSIQILLGIIAGIIMTEIVPPGLLSNSSFDKPVLALLGGFSSDAIFSILKGIIDKLKNIFITSKN
ncbi:hypothetical protein BTO04_00360 [Polaribacter sp. SA4-10]|uniref:hypothetical protein n=1 Tax=Polaribacter sp. SA4-10 TaxID=754397 RepID=UPI000B3CA69F|nr:hypothetical protein [Polaribacter sp. SA4-10]ARV05236.1 hypothetical protein BTO04_00360 [Polaribacter sp. SA4-10]